MDSPIGCRMYIHRSHLFGHLVILIPSQPEKLIRRSNFATLESQPGCRMYIHRSHLFGQLVMQMAFALL